jgi:hypothetical protein
MRRSPYRVANYTATGAESNKSSIKRHGLGENGALTISYREFVTGLVEERPKDQEKQVGRKAA